MIYLENYVILFIQNCSLLTRDKNARIRYGYSSFKGKRSTMEDYYEIKISEVQGKMVALFGVYDGTSL